jgi:hypothetical protein
MHNRLNRYRPSIPRYAPRRGTFGSWADRRTASQRPAGRPWRRRAGYLSRLQLTAPRPAPYPHRARRMRDGTFAGSGDACCIRIRATGVRVRSTATRIISYARLRDGQIGLHKHTLDTMKHEGLVQGMKPARGSAAAAAPPVHRNRHHHAATTDTAHTQTST